LFARPCVALDSESGMLRNAADASGIMRDAKVSRIQADEREIS
jgi:hypothetical protein